MPVLDNARHERFCQAVVSGMSAYAAHGEAGYKRDRGNAAALRANPLVSARIAELQEAMGLQCIKTAAEVARFCEEVIFTPIAEVNETSVLVQEMQYEQMKSKGNEGRETVKVKMPSKLEAVEKLAKLRGWYAAERLNVDAGDTLKAWLGKQRKRK